MGNKTRTFALVTSTAHCPGSLHREVRQEKEIKGIQTGEEKAVTVSADNTCMYVRKNPKESTNDY